MITDFLWVALGGGLGSLARFGVSQLFSSTPAAYEILGINLLGSFIMGAVMPWSLAHGQRGRLFFGVGVLGGFTTFSTFVLDMALLLNSHGYISAFSYGVGGLGFGLAACWMGAVCMRAWLKAGGSQAELGTEPENEDVS